MTADRSRVYIANPEVVKSLSVGERVVLYEPDDFEVEATIELQSDAGEHDFWCGVIHWDTLRDL
ncbi:MAG: hypothetical protein KJ065_22350 [Anaerolineae bacterium]|nr:hypothetical protein [Anaerolineae bacterium]